MVVVILIRQRDPRPPRLNRRHRIIRPEGHELIHRELGQHAMMLLRIGEKLESEGLGVGGHE